MAFMKRLYTLIPPTLGLAAAVGAWLDVQRPWVVMAILTANLWLLAIVEGLRKSSDRSKP